MDHGVGVPGSVVSAGGMSLDGGVESAGGMSVVFVVVSVVVVLFVAAGSVVELVEVSNGMVSGGGVAEVVASGVVVDISTTGTETSIVEVACVEPACGELVESVEVACGASESACPVEPVCSTGVDVAFAAFAAAAICAVEVASSHVPLK